MSRIYYILEHKKTGDCMPELKRGYTHWEPGTGIEPVRLFTTKQGASQSRDWWAAGIAVANPVHDEWGMAEGVELNISVVEGRRKDDLMIVPVTLVQQAL